MKIGIKIKLALILSAILLVATTSMGVIMIVHQRSSLESQMRSMAGTLTGEFAQDSKIPLLQKDSLALNLLVQNIGKYKGVRDVYILNDKLGIEGHSRLDRVGTEFTERARILGDDFDTSGRGEPPWLVSEDDGIITFVSPMVFQDTTVGYTVVSFSKAFISERVRGAATGVVVLAIVAMILVSLLSIPLAGRLLRPLFRLFKGTKEIASGNLDYRIPEWGGDEMGKLISSFNMMAQELKKKEVLKGVFNRYVSPDVADEIMKEPEVIRLGGERRDVTVFFADIRDFTTHSGRMSPEEIVEVLNSYFTLITEVVFGFKGTIDKFIGDAVMGVFGSPIRTDAHLGRGIKAVFAIREVVSMINLLREATGQTPFKIGIGIDSGTVIVGNMGSSTRMEFTAVGPAVNMASRLSSIARADEILVSSALYESIKEMVVVAPLTDTSIKGIDRPVKLYNIVELKGKWKDEVDEFVQEATKSFVLEAGVH